MLSNQVAGAPGAEPAQEMPVESLQEESVAALSPTAAEPTLVKVIRRKAGLVLVEWETDVPRRAWVTPDQIEVDMGSTALVLRPEAGIPYGVEFWRLIALNEALPQDLDRALKRRGIWTIAELRASPQQVNAAIREVYGITLGALLNATKRYESEVRGAGQTHPTP